MDFINLLRVKHWVKNLFIFLPLFFAGALFDWSKYSPILLGFISFSLIASAIYILNDYRDIEADKNHPKKSKRPLASGKISKSTGIMVLVVCLILGLGLAYFIKIKFLIVVCIYLALNVAYSFGLKNVPILDIIIVAIGFNLRVKAGGVLAEVAVSQWLTVMIFLLSLFLAVAKRRDDILIKNDSGIDMRKSVKGYNLDFINSTIAILSSIILVSYLMYTFSSQVYINFGTHRLFYTVLFVLAGMLRYLQIVFVENNTGSPTNLLYKDRFIQVSIILWFLSFYLLIYFPEVGNMVDLN